MTENKTRGTQMASSITASGKSLYLVRLVGGGYAYMRPSAKRAYYAKHNLDVFGN